MNDLQDGPDERLLRLRSEQPGTHPATPVDVIQTQQDLLGNLLDDMWWDAAVLIPLDEAEQVLPEHLKDHADVLWQTLSATWRMRMWRTDKLTLPFIPSCVKWSRRDTT